MHDWCFCNVQALDAGTAAVLPEGLRSELEQLEDSGGVRHLNDLKDQIQVRLAAFCLGPAWKTVFLIACGRKH